jgi:hypothetical protein
LTVDAESVVSIFGEADAVITDAETFLAALVLERFHAAGSHLSQTVEGGENIHRDMLRNRADVGFGLIGETDPLQATGSLSSSR